MKTCFYETSNVFYLETYFHKTASCFQKFNENKVKVSLDSFDKFAYFSSYLQTKKRWK